MAVVMMVAVVVMMIVGVRSMVGHAQNVNNWGRVSLPHNSGKLSVVYVDFGGGFSIYDTFGCFVVFSIL